MALKPRPTRSNEDAVLGMFAVLGCAVLFVKAAFLFGLLYLAYVAIQAFA